MRFKADTQVRNCGVQFAVNLLGDAHSMAAQECCSRASRFSRSARRDCSLRSAAMAALEVFTSHAGLHRSGRAPDTVSMQVHLAAYAVAS